MDPGLKAAGGDGYQSALDEVRQTGDSRFALPNKRPEASCGIGRHR